MRSTLLLVFALIVVCGCAPEKKNDVTIVPAPGKADVIRTPVENEEMNAAIVKAQDGMESFIERLRTAKPGETFAVKAGLPAPGGIDEHIWIDNPIYANGKFTGTVRDTPVNLPNLKSGSQFVVLQENVSDWMIMHDEVVEGGFTLDVQRKAEGKDPLPR